MSKLPIEDALETIAPQLHQMANHYARYGALDAQDLVQDATIKIWCNYESFNPDFAFGAWALRVAYNSMTDAYRRSRRLVFVSLDAPVPEGDYAGLQATFGDMTPDPHDFVAQLERAAWVTELLSYTSKDCAEALRLHVLGQSEPEQAEALGWNVGTLKSRKFRAKAQIRERWAATQERAGL